MPVLHVPFAKAIKFLVDHEPIKTELVLQHMYVLERRQMGQHQ